MLLKIDRGHGINKGQQHATWAFLKFDKEIRHPPHLDPPIVFYCLVKCTPRAVYVYTVTFALCMIMINDGK